MDSPPASIQLFRVLTTNTPSPAPVERIKAVNHHLRVALDEVSEAVLILQNGISPGDGPVIAWGNAAALRCTGISGADLFGAPLQPLLTGPSWQALITALTGAFHGVAEPCELTFANPATPVQQGRVKATLGPKGEILGVILTLTPLPAPAPATAAAAAAAAALALSADRKADPSDAGAAGAASAAHSSPKPEAVPRRDGPPPSPQGWQEDVIETIRETARQVAHEFNNALTSIVLPVQLAIRAIPQNGDLYESLEVAHVSAQRASDLAKDFLDCFRPRSAVRSRCAPASLLGRSIRLATCAQNVSSVTEIEDGLPEIEADESQLERVIFNLIRNSCQAMPSGGRLRVAAVKRELRGEEGIALPPGPYLQISVRDWGPGIPEEHLQHLFHGRFTTKPEGNGCGLPICYQIVRDHGGEMLVRSRVNVGTEFLIYLPVAAAPAGTGLDPIASVPLAAVPQHPPTGAGVESQPRTLTSPVPSSAVGAVPSAYSGSPGLTPGLPPLVPLIPSLARPAEGPPSIAAATGWPPFTQATAPVPPWPMAPSYSGASAPDTASAVPGYPSAGSPDPADAAAAAVAVPVPPPAWPALPPLMGNA
ncbi:MAG: sensory box histidine kinase/response regulator, partial [Verrucomicrobiales bacterium]|nr:sensory box histidine kinase/response regulator [Verrucomicrobiales bacterium]